MSWTVRQHLVALINARKKLKTKPDRHVTYIICHDCWRRVFMTAQQIISATVSTTVSAFVAPVVATCMQRRSYCILTVTVKSVNAFPTSNSGDCGMQGSDLLQKWGVQTPKVGSKYEVEGDVLLFVGYLGLRQKIIQTVNFGHISANLNVKS